MASNTTHFVLANDFRSRSRCLKYHNKRRQRCIARGSCMLVKMVDFQYILGCLFLMSFGGIDAMNTRQHEPSFCEPYNFTCKFDHGMLARLSFTSVDQTKTTTLYTFDEQHATFRELYGFDVKRDSNGIHVVFIILNVTSRSIGTYKCMDDSNGSLVETHVINSSGSVPVNDDCYTNQKVPGTYLHAGTIFGIVLATVIATIVVAIVMHYLKKYFQNKMKDTGESGHSLQRKSHE